MPAELTRQMSSSAHVPFVVFLGQRQIWTASTVRTSSLSALRQVSMQLPYDLQIVHHMCTWLLFCRPKTKPLRTVSLSLTTYPCDAGADHVQFPESRENEQLAIFCCLIMQGSA